MRFLENGEIAEWARARGWPLDEHERQAADPRLPHRARWLYATGERSGREASVASTALQSR
jgi:hypothetical protein